MKKKNETLEELMVGVLVSGLIIQIVEAILALIYPQFGGKVQLSFVIGLWAGIATAEALAYHMSHSIEIALDLLPQDAESYMRRAYFLRTAIILAVAVIIQYFKLGHVMATFLGVLCLKFGAFLQPVVHRVLPNRLPPPTPEELAAMQAALEEAAEGTSSDENKEEEYCSKIEQKFEQKHSSR